MILPTMRWLYSKSVIPGNALFNRTKITANTANRRAVIIKESQPPVPEVCEMTFGMLMQDRKHTYVNVEQCDRFERLSLIEKQLRAKRNGINRSLGKVAYTKKALGKCVAIHGNRSVETTAMAEKLYAMADELQSLLAM